MEQPNNTNDEAATLTLRFWIALVVAGVAAGLFGDGLMWIINSVQHHAFHYSVGSLQSAAEATSKTRRLIVLTLAGLLGGVGWYLLRHLYAHQHTDFDDAVWRGEGDLGVEKSLLNSVLAVTVIGMGASIGREAAPKLMSGAFASEIARRFMLTKRQRTLLVACAGGAGFAAVYNIPLAGALFSAEVLIGSVTLPVILPALACTVIACVTAWIYLPNQPTYLAIPSFHLTTSLMVFATIAGLFIGVFSTGYIRLIGWAAHRHVRGGQILFTFPLAMVVLGLIGFQYPELFGNGKDIAQSAFLGESSALLLLALFLLKPLVTALSIGAGGSGGLFTPTLATGATLGGLGGGLWLQLWPGEPLGAFAMVGAAAMLSASMQAPLASLAAVLELTHTGFEILVPMMIATVIATVSSHRLDGYSIYSARLPAAISREGVVSPARGG